MVEAEEDMGIIVEEAVEVVLVDVVVVLDVALGSVVIVELVVLEVVVLVVVVGPVVVVVELVVLSARSSRTWRRKERPQRGAQAQVTRRRPSLLLRVAASRRIRIQTELPARREVLPPRGWHEARDMEEWTPCKGAQPWSSEA